MDWGTIIDNTVEAAFGQEAIIYALAAIGLNLHFGYTGLLNFGQVGFMAAGAYGVGISSTYYGWPLWVGVLVGFAAAVVLALLLGFPTLRLRADYLGIVTIAAGEIIRLVMRAAELKDWSGGSNGLNGFANGFQDVNPFNEGEYGIWFVEYSSFDTWELVIGWGAVLLGCGLLFLLVRSPWGRVIRAIREDEDAARALGKNVYQFKMQSLILGGLFGAAGGMFFAVSVNSVQPDNYARAVTFFALTAAIIGGLARVMGPVIGSMIFWMILAFLDNFLRELDANDYIPDSIMSGPEVGAFRFVFVGVLLVLLMVFRPQGIFGDRREIALDER